MSILVTGVHRSGTSAVARLVDALGLASGDGPKMPAAPENVRGFFERADVAELNDKWLKRLGGSWSAPPDTRCQDWRRLDEKDLRDSRSRIDLLRGDRHDWYAKDPLLCLLLPLWDRLALQTLPLVLAVRSPVEVAASLQLRNGMTQRRALALWMHYTDAVLSTAGTRPVLVLDYDSLLQDPEEGVNHLIDFLVTTGHPRPDEIVAARTSALVEPAIRRQHTIDPIAASNDRELRDALEVYQALCKRHGDDLDGAKISGLPAWVDEVLAEQRDLHTVEVGLAQAGHESARWRETSEKASASLAAMSDRFELAAQATKTEEEARWRSVVEDQSGNLEGLQAELTKASIKLSDAMTELCSLRDELGQAQLNEDDARRATLLLEADVTGLKQQIDDVAQSAVEREESLRHEHESQSRLALEQVSIAWEQRLSGMDVQADVLREELTSSTVAAAEAQLSLAEMRTHVLVLERREAAAQQETLEMLASALELSDELDELTHASADRLTEMERLRDAAETRVADLSFELGRLTSLDERRGHALYLMSEQLEQQRYMSVVRERELIEDHQQLVAEADALRGRVESACRELTSSREVITAFRQDLITSRERLSVLQKDLAASRNELCHVTGKLSVVTGDLVASRDELSLVTRELSVVTGDLVASRDELSEARSSEFALQQQVVSAVRERDELGRLAEELRLRRKKTNVEIRELRAGYERQQSEASTRLAELQQACFEQMQEVARLHAEAADFVGLAQIGSFERQNLVNALVQVEGERLAVEVALANVMASRSRRIGRLLSAPWRRLRALRTTGTSS